MYASGPTMAIVTNPAPEFVDPYDALMAKLVDQ
jgi:hypothetical protein